jgi:glycerol-3-phosphate dehydrogenase
MDAEIAVVGAGVVGAAVALELARRGASVALLEAEPAPALQASGTNSGILHTGFDSPPGEFETELILRAAELRDPVLDALGVPVLRCGALMRPLRDGDEAAIERLAENARRNGVEAELGDNGSLAVPGEAATDPVAFTLALVAAAERHGAELRTGFPIVAIERGARGITLSAPDGASIRARVVVNCAGVGAGRLARLAGDESFEIYPRKGEFLVFEPPAGEPLRRIRLPVPSESTKGVLVFPTVDGKVVAGPTAVDQEDPNDWAVRPEARAEIVPKAAAMYPPLADLEPIFSYAGLRPAGRGVNYVIGPSAACPGLVNVAAIRSTGLTSSVGIGERVAATVAELGVELRERAPLSPVSPPRGVVGPWWRRTAEHRSVAGGRAPAAPIAEDARP